LGPGDMKRKRRSGQTQPAQQRAPSNEQTLLDLT
jgi:hypothetical protein